MTHHGTRQWLSSIAFVVLLVAGLVLVAACAESDGDGGAATAPPATNPPAAASPTTPPTEPPAAASPTTPPDTPTVESPEDTPVAEGTTAETLAEAGQEVYVQSCASCHGERGEGGVGPAVIGERARLDSYGTAEGLYNYTHIAMPQNAPGSLPDEEYLEVVTYLLLQNEYVQPDTPVSMERLSEIELQ